ncbi:MAG: 7-carboxy-7-deazaguanine synthase QueE [Phycisphaerales bacterium]
MKTPTLLINEIFHSIQGESTWAGLPCTFVRLTGCHLRCAYCDTEYAFHEGDRMTLDEIVAKVKQLQPAQSANSQTPLPQVGERLGEGDESRIAPRPSDLSSPQPSPCKGEGAGAPRTSRLIEVTGGEPLLQPNVHPLMGRLADAGFTVLIETSGACDISTCDDRVIRIMDFKTPGSGEAARNLWSNVEHLNHRDEVKFVLTGRADYDWAKEVIAKYDLAKRVNAVLFSAVNPVPPGKELPGAGATGLSLRDLAEWILADGLPVRLQTQLHKLIWHPQTRGV